MAATIPNIAKGRINQFVRNVVGNDPTNSALVVVLLQSTGLDTLAQLRDYDDLDTLLSSNTECSVASYSRLVLDDGDISNPTVDDTGDEQTFNPGSHTFGNLETGQTIAASVVCYDPDTTSGDDTTLIPIHVSIPDSPVATDGGDFPWSAPDGLWTAREPT